MPDSIFLVFSLVGQVSAQPRINVPLTGVWCPARPVDFSLNLTPGAKAGVDQIGAFKNVESVPVGGQVFRLPPDRRLPAQSEPSQILLDGINIFLVAPPEVDILNAEEETAPGTAGVIRCQGGIGVANVEEPGRTGRKPRDLAPAVGCCHVSVAATGWQGIRWYSLIGRQVNCLFSGPGSGRIFRRRQRARAGEPCRPESWPAPGFNHPTDSDIMKPALD